MRDVTELLEAAAVQGEGGSTLRDFVDQLRDARVTLDLTGDDFEESIATATLSVSNVGGAIRTVIGSRRTHAVGVYPSAKTGWLNPYDERLERALIHWCEADGQVSDFQTQAGVLRFRTPWGNGAWIMDMMRELRDGTVEVIEVKPSASHLRKPRYAAKLACAAAVSTSLGFRFRLMYRDEIRGSFFRRWNVARVQGRRRTKLHDGVMDRFEERAAAGELTDIGSVRRLVHDDPLRGMAGVHRLVASGRVLVDLDAYLCDASPIRIASPFEQSRIRF